MSGMVHCPLGLQCDLPKVLCNECTSLRARETCPPQSRCNTAIASPELFKAQVSRGAAKKCCRLHNDLSPACWSSRWQIVQGSNPITAEGSTLRSLVCARLADVHCTISPTNRATVRATTRVGSHPLSRVTGTDFVWTGHSGERLVQCCTATINAGVTQYVVVTRYFVGAGEDR